MQHNKYVEHKDVKMYCAKNQFIEFSFLVQPNTSHVVRRLGKNYHVRFDSKLGHDTCVVHYHIPCECPPCTSMLNQPWAPDIPEQKLPRYQPVEYCTYWHVLGYFNSWNIIRLAGSIFWRLIPGHRPQF